MAEITLTGGPKDGVTVDVDAGQVEVLEGGCVYRHCGKTGCYIYWGGEDVEPEPVPEPEPTPEVEPSLPGFDGEEDEPDEDSVD